MYKKGNVAGVQLLVQWNGQEATEASWEDFDEFKARFLDFPVQTLWARLFSKGEVLLCTVIAPITSNRILGSICNVLGLMCNLLFC